MSSAWSFDLGEFTEYFDSTDIDLARTRRPPFIPGQPELQPTSTGFWSDESSDDETTVYRLANDSQSFASEVDGFDGLETTLRRLANACRRDDRKLNKLQDAFYWNVMSRNGYTEMEELGLGAFSTVHMAYHEQQDRHVAVKVIDAVRNDKVYLSEYLPVEKSIWPQLKHPNIVPLLEQYADPHWVYFVMDWSVSGDIVQWLRADNIPVLDQMIKWLYQIARGMSYLKERGFVHGDIKLNNVLVFGDDVKLCDFGCIKKLSKKCEQFSGTPGYVAPEVLLLTPYDCEKADVFSLGICSFIILCHMLEMPYFDIWNRDNDDKWNHALPIAGQELFHGMLMENPDDRFNIDQVVASSWFDDFRELADNAPAGEEKHKRDNKRKFNPRKSATKRKRKKSGTRCCSDDVMDTRRGSKWSRRDRYYSGDDDDEEDSQE